MTPASSPEPGSSILDSSAAASAEVVPRRTETTGGYSWYVLGVLFLVYAINFIDRQIPSILAQDIKASLGVSDAQLGFLYGTAFAIFYSLFGIPLGRLADIWYRGRLIAAGLAVWSAMTALSGLAGSFGQLALARIGVGIGEASASPAAYSLLGDYFPARRRGLALGIYSSGLTVGAGLSLPLGGALLVERLRPQSRTVWARRLAGRLSRRRSSRTVARSVGMVASRTGTRSRRWTRRAGDETGRVARLRSQPRSHPAALHPVERQPVSWSASDQSFNPGGDRERGSRAPVVHARCGAGVGFYAVASWLQMLRATDRPTYELLFGHRASVFALIGFGTTAFVSYSLIFWTVPYAMRTFAIRADIAGLWLGVPASFGASAGILAGGFLSDIWKRHNPRGRESDPFRVLRSLANGIGRGAQLRMPAFEVMT